MPVIQFDSHAAARMVSRGYRSHTNNNLPQKNVNMEDENHVRKIREKKWAEPR